LRAADRADTVHLISTAATPLGGDTIRVRIVVEPGPYSGCAPPRDHGGCPVRHHGVPRRLGVEVAGQLDSIPTDHRCGAGAARDVDAPDRGGQGSIGSVSASKSADRERQGFWTGSLRRRHRGAPLLRHRIELGAGSVTDDELGTPRACVSELRYPETDSTRRAPTQSGGRWVA